MIRSFEDKETERVWQGKRSRRLRHNVQASARRKLRMLNNAQSTEDARIPLANRLEALKGNRRGQHSIRINDRRRICFVWRDGEAYDVEIVNDH